MALRRNTDQDEKEPIIVIENEHIDQTPVLPVWRKLCFAVGGAPYQTTNTVINFFISIFLLEVAEIPPSYVSIILFVGKVWDAITDPTCGYLVHRCDSRWGKFRPWILFSAPLACGAYFCLWYVPHFSEGGKFVWYFCFYCSFQMLLSMAKSHAQRQKEYRERKKAEAGTKWLENESKRTGKYYKKVSKLTKREAEKVREQWRVKKKVYRARKEPHQDNDSGNNGSSSNVAPAPSCSTDIQMDEISSSTSDKMIVKLNHRKGQKNKSKKKQKAKVDYLVKVKKSLEKKNSTLRRQILRLKQKTKTSTTRKQSPKTPRSATEREMRESGLQPNQHLKIKKRLMFAHCLTKEIRHRISLKTRRDQSVKKIIAGRILQSYRLTQYAANLVGVRVRPKMIKPTLLKQKAVHVKVKDFLEREDNSRQLPGKADSVKNEKKERVQKFVLNDYLKNIFLKFKAEYPHQKISFATFCRARPKHITLVNYAARVTCLCTKHQNFALRLQFLKRLGLTTNTSPDSFSDTTTTDELKDKVNSLPEQQIGFKQWRRVKCDDGKHRTKLLDIDQNRDEFTKSALSEFEEFKGHAKRVREQYQAFKQMKANLGEQHDHVIVQMDFSENYNIKEMEEIQSAYWNQESVTIHPVVMYFKGENDIQDHKSMVVVSEVLHHNSSMVQAILDKVILWVKEVHPVVKYIHYWTDSPTSQYRNKMMFDVVANHSNLYNIDASWHFFEAGHGKGACDGIGGVVKRTADTAIKSGKFNITCAKDFYDWGLKSESKIKYEFINRAEYEEARVRNETRQKYLNAVKGTLKLHAVAGIGECEIMVRDTTCVCSSCYGDEGFIWSSVNTCGWNKECLSKTGVTRSDHHIEHIGNIENENNIVMATNEVDSSSKVLRDQLSVGEFVAAKYDDETYIGKLIDMDEGLFEIQFMENGKKVKDCLKWPLIDDIIWVEPENILCKVDTPIATGKGNRVFKLSESDIDRVKAFEKK